MSKKIMFLLLSFFILQTACAQTEKANPYEWDFGQVVSGELAEHDFVIKNSTSDILEISNIHNSCGCVVSQPAKKSLLPEESAAVKVTFNSSGYAGPITQFVYVHTDNADLAIIKLTIKANVVSENKPLI